ncbi:MULTISPECIES: fasciclin domain-containing protein [Psychrobacter]|uniref:fasciclin domain-containing protein n=1 Tax=Psychrobacter TaxID=497 RepID=UPI00146A0FF5|nr:MULTISPECIES: fasciclin domain-containing protein [Psychrobacter]
MLKKSLLPLSIAAMMALSACSNNTKPADETDAAATTTEPATPASTTEAEPAPAVVPEAPVDEMDPAAANVSEKTIGEIAAETPDLSTLTAALKDVGLDTTLMSENGRFTVFAPTNAAFDELLTKLNMTKEQLFADKEMLKAVLSYHVIPEQEVKAADIPYGTDIKTVNGQTFMIDKDNMITDASGNKASIAKTDILASNGVVHVIDKVLLPKQ